MELAELISKSKEDLNLSDELDRDAQDLPRRKAQWSEWISLLAVAYKKADWKFKRVKKERFEYYFTGYNITLDKRDIREIYLPGDSQVIDAQKILELVSTKLELAERTLAGLNRMGFDIKNVIDYRKFMSGLV
jgi:hypothetical protein